MASMAATSSCSMAPAPRAIAAARCPKNSCSCSGAARRMPSTRRAARRSSRGIAAGREWRGAMTYLPPVIPGNPTLGRHHRGVRARGHLRHRRLGGLVPTALGLLVLTIVVAFAVAAIVSERYLPPLRALQRGLARLRERRFETLPRSTVEEFTPLEREFNATSHLPAARLARVRSARRSRSRTARRQRDRSRARHRCCRNSAS